MSVALAAQPAAALRPGAICIRTERLNPSTLLVDAAGELDAANARQLVDHVSAIDHPHSTLIVDLRGLTFFGTEGLWAVNRIIAASAKRHASPVLVAGPEVRRLLRICDPHGALRTVSSVVDALVASKPNEARALIHV
ncbi:STAS domain-containing protein [Mycolicibacterium sp. GCM10028919]|uniref:STAS domain-containing protein n=1 Tax=Mycolicibacterium sp. GCM10028919 TaxID=3273401 RepID=UPI00360C25B8